MIMKLFVAFILCMYIILAEAHRSPDPRLEFTHDDMKMKRITLPHKQTHIQLFEDGANKVIMKADQHLYALDFAQETNITTLGSRCEGGSPQVEPYAYNITVLHKLKGIENQVFLCETSETRTKCCIRDLSPSGECRAPKRLEGISSTIKEYRLRAGEPSLFIEAPGSDVLYVTQSSTENSIGIYKFGSNRVRPTAPDNAPLPVEPHYMGLVPFEGTNRTQDKLYAFFKEKNTAGAPESDMWLPFVAQVCMADTGGPKTKLQYQWTTQLKARLFCGDKASKQHFPELVGVAFYHQKDGDRVYGLFRNEWNMSAVCVFSVGAIRNVFETSSFKGIKVEPPVPRPGACTPFTGQQSELLQRLSFVQSHPEMDNRVFPESAPLLVSNHHYTRIRLHAVAIKGGGHHIVLYLSLESGKIHKVLERKSGAFIIAEYSPFSDRTHVVDMMLQGDERKLYVSSSREVVQVEMQQCDRYGPRCEDCVLASDPYCGWDRTHSACVPATKETLQDVEGGNHSVCTSRKKYFWKSTFGKVPEEKHSVAESRHFLHCPVTSRHAEYTWHGPGNVTMACKATEDGCDLPIDSIGPENQGIYSCMAVELGYKRTVVSPSAAGPGRHGGSGVDLVWLLGLLQLAAILVLQNTD
ncbi:unnamed protein product [Arctogadus glacialis]